MKIADTAAVITGAASGLGEATARNFAEGGALVTVLDRDVDGAKRLPRHRRVFY